MYKNHVKYSRISSGTQGAAAFILQDFLQNGKNGAEGAARAYTETTKKGAKFWLVFLAFLVLFPLRNPKPSTIM